MANKRRRLRERKINPTLYVFCEGKTEVAYISLLKKYYRLPSIVIKPKISGSDVSREFINKFKQGTVTHEKDVDFLLYDGDVDATLERLRLIEDVELLISNPCIETWFLLHFKNQTGHTTFDYCKRELDNRNGIYKKGTIDKKLEEKLITKVGDAIRRAKSLEDFGNPSSTIYKFVDLLSELKDQ